jgi:hypothetical protein
VTKHIPERKSLNCLVLLMNRFAVQVRELVKLSDAVQFYTGATIKNNKMCCPFHSEKTPSFTLFPNNSYYCFGCGEDGDVIKFVMRLFDISFSQALVRLNNDFGLRLQVSGTMDKKAIQEARERIERQHREQDEHRHSILDKYWTLFDKVLCMENVIKRCKPKNVEDVPDPMFIYSLQNLGHTKYLLEIASEERRQLNE